MRLYAGHVFVIESGRGIRITQNPSPGSPLLQK
jgi:hypothetical protein